MNLRRIIIFLGIFEVLLIGTHFLIYLVAVFLLNIDNTHARVSLAITLGALSLIFVLSSVFTRKNHSPAARIFYRISAAWMVIYYFLFIAATLAIILDAILRLDSNAGRILAEVLFILAGACGIYALINAEIIRIVHRKITLSHLPEFWKGKTIVFFSDIHLGHVHDRKYAKRITKKVNALHPQAVLISGDMFDGPDIDAGNAVEPFRSIIAPLGTYFISGNHDEFTEDGDFFKAIENIGSRILDGQTVDLNGIAVTGVDYLKTNSKQKFKEFLDGLILDRNKPNILLKHVPSDLDLAMAKGFDLSLCGHTHNGQMFPLGYLAKRIYGFNYGLKALGSMNVLVSSGVGTWGPQGRFGTKSEVVVIDFIS